MATILLLLFAVLQVGLALFQPAVLVYVSLLTGGFPLSLGAGGMIASDFGRMDLSAIRLFGLLAACGSVVLLQVGRSWKYLIAWRFHVAFLLFCCVALLWAPSMGYGLRMIAKLSAPFLFLVFVLLAMSSVRQLKVMENVVLCSGALMLAYAVASKILGILDADAVGLTIPSTTPALFTANVLTAGVLALACARYANRWRNLLLVGLVAGAVIAGNTRITIGAMFLAVSAMLFLTMRGVSRILLPVAGLITLPALFLLNKSLRERMFHGEAALTFGAVLNDPSVILQHLHSSGRFPAWSAVLARFFEPTPMFGSGIGATQHFFYSQAGAGIGVIHSEYVRLLAEVGLVGLTLFLVAAAAYVSRLVGTYRRSEDPQTRTYAAAGLGALLVYLIFMATDNAFDYVNAFGVYVFALIGMSVKAQELEAAARERAPATDGALMGAVDEPGMPAPSRGRRRFELVSD